MSGIKLAGPKREAPGIKPSPDVPLHPLREPEITPRPEKNDPYRPSPEIKPVPAPEVAPDRERK